MTELILMIDDNEDDLRLYRRALKNVGYTLEAAKNAETGLAAALAMKPCLILLDYNLPDMSGLEFMNKFIENYAIRIPVVMLTGEGSEQVAVEAMKNGASDYIVKDTSGFYLRLLPTVIARALQAQAEQIENLRLKNLHQTILRTVVDGILEIDSGGIIRFANQSAENILLSIQSWLIGRDITDLLWPDGKHSDWSRHPVASMRKDEVSICRESDIFLRENGESFPVSYTASRLNTNNDTFIGWVLVFQNITERKQMELELIRSELRLKELFENLSSGVAVYQISPDGQDFIFTAFNVAAERIENIHREDLIGKKITEVFPGVTELGLLDVFRRVWKSGVAEHFPITFYHDGRIAGWRNNYVYKLSHGEIVAIYDDVTKEKQAEEKMHYLAHYDLLTSLPNRALFNDRLQQSLVTAKRDKVHIAIMFLDLDNFKPVNDTLGHDVGDLLLKEVAQRLLACARESDTLSRIGGDEFVVLLHAIETTQDAMLVADKMLHALSQPFEISGHDIRISASIGVAVYPEHGSDEKKLTKNADVAMYHAKRSGRNNAVLYQADISN